MSDFFAHHQASIVAPAVDHIDDLGSFDDLHTPAYINSASITDTDAQTNTLPEPTALRPFIPISCGTDIIVRTNALYDTGASATCISSRFFSQIQAAKVPCRKLNQGVALSAANGGKLNIVGFYSIPFVLLRHKIDIPVVVVGDLTKDAIIGMPTITNLDIRFSPKSGTFSLGQSTTTYPAEMAAIQNNFTTTHDHEVCKQAVALNGYMKPCQRTLLTPNSTTRIMVNCRLADHTELQAPLCVFASICSIPSVLTTTARSKAMVYVVNPTDDFLVLERDMIIGTFSSLDTVEPVTFAQVLAILPDTNTQPTCTQAKKDLINRTVQAHVPQQFRAAYVSLLRRFHDVLSSDSSDLGRTNTVEHNIQLRDAEPVYTKQFPIPDVQLQFIKDQIAKWLALGLISRSRSKYNAPIFCIDAPIRSAQRKKRMKHDRNEIKISS